jgi:hypothetical protein
MPLNAAWGIISPNGFGNPLRHNWSWMFNYDAVAISYAGLLPLALFLAAAASRRTGARERLWIGLAVLLFVVAMNWSAAGHLISAVPPFSLVANDKLRFVCIFIVAIVGAKLLDGAGSSTGPVALYFASVLVGALAVYVYVKRVDLMRPADLIGLVALIIFLILPQRMRPWAAVFLASVELFAFNAGFNALVDAKYFRPRLPIVDVLRAHAPREPFRVAGLDWMFLPNAEAQYGLEDVRGSDPMAFADYDRFLQRFTLSENGSWIRRIVDANRPELSFLNVRFLLTEPGANPGGVWRLIYRGADGMLWENPALFQRFFSPSAQVRNLRMTAPGEFAMTIVSPRNALIQSSETLGPGRRVYVRGRRVPFRHIENAFIGFDVPAGQSDVRVVYRPMTFYISSIVALLTVFALALYRSTQPIARSL